MKCVRIAALAACTITGLASAQSVDVLGSHANAGHGCAACHARHIASERPARAATATARDAMLWGDQATGLPKFSATIALPSPHEQRGMLLCLSCHDGNYAPPAMMMNRIYEPVPQTYGTVSRPLTLADRTRVTTGLDLDQHPVGDAARLDCNGDSGWDCALTEDGLAMSGRNSARFVSTYGYFVKPRRSGDKAVVVCTTCHNPHLMSIVQVGGNAASSRYPEGTYATRFFLRAPYGSGQDAGNQSAQFCRECHADKSNEMNGRKPG